MADNKLHFLRLRRKDSTEPFCDPMADIKQVVQQAFKDLPVLYKEVFKDEEKANEEKADYLKAYLKVFITRLEEDKTPLLKQLDDFTGAMQSKFTKEELALFEQMLGRYVLHTFALYERRDGSVDAKERGAIRAAGAVLELKQLLPEELFKQVLEALPEASKQLQHFDNTVSTVDALCVEDASKTIKNIKDVVAWHFNSGHTWEETAKACDSYVQTADNITDKEIAAALAYPDYKSPYFEIEVEDGAGTETSET